MDNFVIGTIQENIKFLSNDLQVINSNIPKRINDLSNVSITGTPANGEVLTYNSSTGKFEPQAQSGGGGGALNELNDIPGVTISGVQANQVLKYINGVWVNSTDTDTTYVGGTAITVTNNVISNDAPDQPVILHNGTNISVSGAYPEFTINSTDTDNLNGLTDTNLTTPFVDNHVLKYSGGKWINDFLNLTGLSDVSITDTPGNGEVLAYNSATDKFEPQAQSGVGATDINGLSDATTTADSLYIGTNSGPNSTGLYNTFLGINSGRSNIDGHNNTFLGLNSGYANTSGFHNTLIGVLAGEALYDGDYNTCVGSSSGSKIASGSQNTFIGVNAGMNCTGNFNTSIGVNSGSTMTEGQNNTFIGVLAGHYTTSSSNTFLGYGAGYWNTSALGGNTFIGTNSGNGQPYYPTDVTNGSYNVFLGLKSGFKNLTGSDNTFIGTYAGENNTGGNNNTYIGRQAGYTNTSGSQNTFVGQNSGFNNTVNYNTFVGYNSGQANTLGSHNTFIGLQAGHANTYGSHNTFIGLQAGKGSVSASNNTFVGLNSGFYNTESNNTFLGTDAGFHNHAGTNNVAIGYNAQFKQDPGGAQYATDETGANDSEYEIVIGASAIGNGSNTITLGATGNPPVSAKLYIPGLQLNATTGDVLTLTAVDGLALVTPGSSDDRIKTHEEIISSETYINYIKQIVPKKYKKYGFILTQEEEAILEAGGDPFKEKKTGDVTHDSKYIPRSEIGVIAQDIYEISGLQDFVKKGDEDIIWAVDYTSINTITLGAVKELIDKIEKLEAKITTLENK